MADICKALGAFGRVGQASKIKHLGLEAMVKRDKSGGLDPKVN